MKLSFKYLALLSLITNISFCQSNCDISMFYEISIDSSIAKSEKKFLVSFDYQISNSLQKSLFESSVLEEHEKLILKQELSSPSIKSICEKIELRIEKLKERPSDNGIYVQISYSKPIFVSDIKVYLFHDALFIREGFSGVKGGSNILETFVLENGVWKLKDKKVLEVY